jgi:hypothetical protein
MMASAVDILLIHLANGVAKQITDSRLRKAGNQFLQHRMLRRMERVKLSDLWHFVQPRRNGLDSLSAVYYYLQNPHTPSSNSIIFWIMTYGLGGI